MNIQWACKILLKNVSRWEKMSENLSGKIFYSRCSTTGSNCIIRSCQTILPVQCYTTSSRDLRQV